MESIEIIEIVEEGSIPAPVLRPAIFKFTSPLPRPPRFLHNVIPLPKPQPLFIRQSIATTLKRKVPDWEVEGGEIEDDDEPQLKSARTGDVK